ncbi:Thioesterase superfamily member [Shewanella piezotolerans WP3]|uniref:Thioesterase superfamily member n=2 Tax=Shewanella TaxID=22 RepID=B8CJI8_SHEPW|nr:Thioesterase superfamily member [Shewanella piezotolerans WP3]
MVEPRITISSNPTTCLKRFEFPLNGQTFSALGINPAPSLIGGQLLIWIDEEGAIFAGGQMQSQSPVTKLISEVNFMTAVSQGMLSSLLYLY